MKRLLLTGLLAVSFSAVAEPLEVIEPIVPATCVVPGTQIVGPCAFIAAMLAKMRSHCLGGCSGGCGGGQTCQVKL